MTTMESLHQQTTHLSRVELIRAVFSAATPDEHHQQELHARGLIGSHGQPTQLGRDYATWLINIGGRQ